VPIDIASIRHAFSEGQVEWRQHALVRLLERNISMEDVVIAWNELEKMAYVVTVYTPDLKHFEEDLKTRRKRETTHD